MTNKSRTLSRGARPDWPKYTIRNINPELWARVIARAKSESHDGAPHLNAVLLHMLELYDAVGLPPLPGFPSRPSVSPTSHPTVSPSTDPSTDPTVSPLIAAFTKVSRYAPDSWGQMLQIRLGDVWDEEPAHVYVRESDVIALLRRTSRPSADPSVSPTSRPSQQDIDAIVTQHANDPDAWEPPIVVPATPRPSVSPLCLRVPCTCGQCPPLRPTARPTADPKK